MSKPDNHAAFDAFARSYVQDLDKELAFSGEGVADFAQQKVTLLQALAQDVLGSTEGLRCLDLGCGTGVASQLLVGRFAQVVGADVSADMIEVARENVPKAEFHHYQPGHLPFEDGSFDLSFCACVFHHVPPDQRRAFTAEMLRVTRPGGLMFTFEHNPYNPLTQHLVRSCELDVDAILLTQRESRTLFEQAGARIHTARYYLFFPGFLRALRPLERWMGWLPLGGQYLVAAQRPL